MDIRDVGNEAAAIALRSTPGAAGASWTIAEGQLWIGVAVGLLTGVLVLLQIAYFIWRWRRNSKLQGMIP